MKAKSSFSLKDQLFNSEKVEYLATLMVQAFPDFAQEKFHWDIDAKQRFNRLSQGVISNHCFGGLVRRLDLDIFTFLLGRPTVICSGLELGCSRFIYEPNSLSLSHITT